MFGTRAFRGLACLFISLMLQQLAICQVPCIMINPCACKFGNGSLIDLTTVGLTNGNPRFQDVPSSNTSEPYTYSYNPCFGFSLEGDCKDVAACQKKINSTTEYYNLGKQGSAKFFMTDSQLAINYTENARVTTVKLICNQTGNTLKVDGERLDAPSNYTFTLHSPCACPDGCISSLGPDDSLSTGSILVILLLIFLLCYLVGGMIFRKIILGATGQELIPNYEFWKDFPILVRDGVNFACNGCQNEASYDRI